jgi:hypothetical protein
MTATIHAATLSAYPLKEGGFRGQVKLHAPAHGLYAIHQSIVLGTLAEARGWSKKMVDELLPNVGYSLAPLRRKGEYLSNLWARVDDLRAKDGKPVCPARKGDLAVVPVTEGAYTLANMKRVEGKAGFRFMVATKCDKDGFVKVAEYWDADLGLWREQAIDKAEGVRVAKSGSIGDVKALCQACADHYTQLSAAQNAARSWIEANRPKVA